MDCPTCDGKGEWQERTEIDGLVELVHRRCNDCKGTGQIDKPGEDPKDDFDINDKDEDD